MPKIERENHKIFGGSGSSDNFAQFGSLEAGSPLKTKDIASIQALPAWDAGFQDAIFSANKALLLEDLNAFSFEHSRQIAYLFQAGVPEWNSGTTYYKGSIVQRTSGGDATGELYMSLTDNNTGNALPVQTDNANWRWINAPQMPPGAMLDFVGIVAPVGFLLADGTAYSRSTYATLFAAMTQTLAGNLTIGLPTVTGIPSTSNLKAGYYVSGVGIPSGAKILTVDGPTQITLDQNATSTQTPSSLTFGANPLGDGSTTFNLPDTRRRVTVGSGGSGTGTLGSQPGAVGGAETHTLTIGEMPSHNHDVSGVRTGSGGIHANELVAQSTNDVSAGFTVDNKGGGGAHNNMQPSIVFMKIIKT